MTDPTHPGIEILICTHNRAELLMRALAYINRAKRPLSSPVSILVMANACSDNTGKLLDEYIAQQPTSGNIPLRYINEPTPGKSNALNTAIQQLEGDYIAMVDDDHRIDNHYLTAIEEAITRHPEATMLCGQIIPDWDGSEPVWVHELKPYVIYPLPVPRYTQGSDEKTLSLEQRMPGGGNMVVQREVLVRTGNFSTELGPTGHNLGGAEDIQYVKRALDNGELLVYIPAIIQYHYVDLDRLKLTYLIQKAYQRSRSLVVIRKPDQRREQVPIYMWRKLFEYLLRLVFSLYWPATRFYLIRCAATLGEISGYLSKGVPKN